MFQKQCGRQILTVGIAAGIQSTASEGLPDAGALSVLISFDSRRVPYAADHIRKAHLGTGSPIARRSSPNR
jgi:hypothetical protein